MATPDHIRAHRHCVRHRDEVLASAICGCFYCGTIFPPSEIVEWTDNNSDRIGQTAICPHCCVDSIIGAESGYPITKEFLAEMRAHWF